RRIRGGALDHKRNAAGSSSPEARDLRQPGYCSATKVSGHVEIQTAGWTYRACTGHRAESGNDQADFIEFRSVGRDPHVRTQILNTCVVTHLFAGESRYR